MDKETLSNYGWIVICVLVLAVMIALASPFGKFVSNAVKSTTAGLFDVNQSALGAAGIVIDDQSFCDHTNTTTIPAGEATEEHPAHDTYSVCNDCGKLMTVDGEIPYTYADFTITSNNRSKVGYTGAENENLVIPETFFDNDTWYRVISIDTQAFMSCANLTSVTIPDSVISIGYGAFRSCSGLISVTIPDSVTTIDAYAFQMCSNLTSVTIPDSVTIISGSAFGLCPKLTTVNLGKSVDTIGASAFQNCTSLTAINIPNSVTLIGYGAFENCSNLTSVTIPVSVTKIWSSAFWKCTNLTSVTFENPKGWWYASSTDATDGTSIYSSALSNPATAATYLKTTYYNKYWQCTVSE